MTANRHRWIAVLTMLWVCGECHGIVGRLDPEPSVFELLAAQQAFAGLAQVIVGGDCCGSTGSGYLLNDEWLVSAAHVVNGQNPAAIRIGWGAESSSVSELHFAQEWMLSPETGLDQGGDLVLIRLAQPFQFGVKTALASGPLDDRYAVMLGMGKGGNGVLGAFDAPVARAATNTIDRQLVSSGGGGLLVTDFDSGSSSQNTLNLGTVSQRYYDDGFTGQLPSELLLVGIDTTSLADAPSDGILQSQFPAIPDIWLEGTTADGDSGGPLMVFDDVTGEWQLAGVTSWGFNPSLPEGFSRYDSRYGDVAFFTDLSQQADWIAATIPEPKLPLMMAGLLLVFLKRKR